MLSFSQALEHLKCYQCVARLCWDRGTYLQISQDKQWIGIMDEYGELDFWNPRHLDLLADDWILIGFIFQT